MSAAKRQEKLLTLKQAVDLVNAQYNVEGVVMLKIKTLYNDIWEKKLTNHGTRRKALVSEDEVLRLHGRKQVSA
jgi:hypothetical protein